jgi:hypothetical protein
MQEMADKTINSDMGREGGVQALADTLRSGDIQRLERAACRGCPITPEDRRQSIEVLRTIMNDPKRNSRVRIMASRVLATLESLDLRDLHHTERMKHEDGILDLRMRRAEEGKPNDCVAIQAAPVRELPLPEDLRSMRKRLIDSSDNN